MDTGPRRDRGATGKMGAQAEGGPAGGDAVPARAASDRGRAVERGWSGLGRKETRDGEDG